MNQITIEEMQVIIGRITMNYELQITRMTEELQRLSTQVQTLTKKEDKNID